MTSYSQTAHLTASARNIIFWSSFLIYFFYVNLLPGSTQDLFKEKTYLNSLQLMIYFPVNILAVYLALRILLPRYIYTGKVSFIFYRTERINDSLFFTGFWNYHSICPLNHHVPYQSLPVSFRWFLPVRYGDRVSADVHCDRLHH